MSTGVENIGKRLVNSREGKVEFEKPVMALSTLMKYGNALVEEQVRSRGAGWLAGWLAAAWVLCEGVGDGVGVPQQWVTAFCLAAGAIAVHAHGVVLVGEQGMRCFPAEVCVIKFVCWMAGCLGAR